MGCLKGAIFLVFILVLISFMLDGYDYVTGKKGDFGDGIKDMKSSVSRAVDGVKNKVK